MSVETIGQRLFAIRRDLGDGWKNPMSQAEFGALLSKKSGRIYDSAMVSRMENGDRKISLDEVDLIAALDPKKRGREWLAWGEATTPHSGEQGARYTTENWRDVTAEAEAELAAEDAEQASKTVRRKNGGRKR